MTIRHNQKLVQNKFRKDWQRYVRCHFDQPGKKVRRRKHRLERAAKLAPRPVDRLRPIVRCPSGKYNRKVRAGRGFSLVELKEAGIPRKLAPTIGIAVDHRRQNLSEESLDPNVARLKVYYNDKLILLPRRSSKHKKGDSSKEEVSALKNGDIETVSVRPTFHQTHENDISYVKKSEIPKGEENAYMKLLKARSDARLVGVREKKAKAEAEAAETKK